MPRIMNAQEAVRQETLHVRRDMLSRKLISLYMRKKQLEMEEKEIKDTMIQENIVAPTESITLDVNDSRFRIAHIVSDTLTFDNVERVFEALPSRKAFFEVVNISVVKLRQKLGAQRIEQLSTGVMTKQYILVTPVAAPRNGNSSGSGEE